MSLQSDNIIRRIDLLMQELQELKTEVHKMDRSVETTTKYKLDTMKPYTYTTPHVTITNLPAPDIT